jgi:hypothetical protein
VARTRARAVTTKRSDPVDEKIDTRELTIENAVTAALRGELAVFSQLPRDLAAEAQQRFNLRRDEAAAKANRLVPPTEGMH